MSHEKEIKKLLNQGRVMAIRQYGKDNQIPPAEIDKLIDKAATDLQKTNR